MNALPSLLAVCDKCGKPIQRNRVGDVMLFEHHRLHYRCLVAMFQATALANIGATVYFELDVDAARFRRSVHYDKIRDC